MQLRPVLPRPIRPNLPALFYRALTLPPPSSPAATEPTTWSIAIYAEKDCAGEYYVVEGHNLEVMNDRCIGLHSSLNTSPDRSLWCRWYSNGGFMG